VPIGPFQGTELLIIFVILLLILGPSKIPALARGLGEAVREFRRAASGIESTKREVERDLRASMSGDQKFLVSESRTERMDDETLIKLAKKLGVETRGRSREQIVEEVIRRAREKGILED